MSKNNLKNKKNNIFLCSFGVIDNVQNSFAKSRKDNNDMAQ